jgi:phage recombination protein Bet
MTNVIPVSANMPTLNWSPKQLATIKDTVARDTDELEFSLFMEYCRVKRLDPFIKQAIAVVFNRDRPEKRQMSIITTRAGYQVMAARCQDYRPASEEPKFTYEDWFIDRQAHLKDARRIADREARAKRIAEIDQDFPVDLTNPDGIEKCTVTLFKQDTKSGEWHPVIGWARWRDYAPVKEEWDWIDGKRRPTGRMTLDGNWPRMGHVMIAKCAESVALRAGWPETFSGVYSEEEMQRDIAADKSAFELVEQERASRRLKTIHASEDDFPFVDIEGNLSFIRAGDGFGAGTYPGHVIGTAKICANVESFDAHLTRNREGLQRFWAKHKDRALEMREELDKIREKLPKPDQK